MGYSMAGKKGQKKRFWSDEEKRSICAQTQASGVSVARVARRYSMNTNLIHKWLRDPRFAPDGSDEDDIATDTPAFLPIEVEGAVSAPSMPLAPVSTFTTGGPVTAHRVDITLSDGRRILVEGSTALSAVLALVEGLMP